MTTKLTLPNSTSVFVLGLCSVAPFFYPIGLITGIIGLVLAANGRKLHLERPNDYDGFKKLNAGYIMSIIGISINGAILLLLLFYIANHAN